MSSDISSIFKAYDIRGRVGSELTSDVAQRVGAALAEWLPNEGPVAVGRDMRLDSADLAAALIEGLRLQGREVRDIGEVTSDMIYFTVGKFGLAGGAMITASHNPGKDNGIKMCREEARPIGIESGLAEIRDTVLAEAIAPTRNEGALLQKDVKSDWVQHVLQFVDATSWPKMRLAIDAGNGMAGAIIPVLQEFLPSVEIIPMYFELDGTFPNHIANPLIPENLVDLQKKVQSEKLDLGIAFDGDGDRAVLIDETGQPLSGTTMTAILAAYFLEKQPGATVLYNAICGRAAKETIQAHGGKAIRTKVGHSFIKADMREHDAIFAGEHSGHYYFKDNFCADSGLIAAVVALQVYAEKGKKLSELAREFRTYATIPETNFEVVDKTAILQRIAGEFKDGEQDTLDGLTVNYPDYWFNLRASNTEPVMRLNAEAKTKEQLATLVAKVKKMIAEPES
ncbi:MAG TPA: phosphomannomutase/phosphoglucomutase [Candidatus Saccharimonadales bacterium]